MQEEFNSYRSATTGDLQNVKLSLGGFNSISLEEISSVSLLKRSDTKYLLHKRDLFPLIEAISSAYRILQIAGNRLMTYRTQYFDTESLKFYTDHHNQRNNRVKVRKRQYVDTNACFLEIKRKDPKGKTHKTRITIPRIDDRLCESDREFIRTRGQVTEELVASLRNEFHRFTLVSDMHKERVTIDLDLSFRYHNNAKRFPDLVIIEIKQDRVSRSSPIMTVLKNLGHQPFRVSKYCIGMISTDASIKYNRFKPKLLKIARL